MASEDHRLIEAVVERVAIRDGSIEIALTREAAAIVGEAAVVVSWTKPPVGVSRELIPPIEGTHPNAQPIRSDTRAKLLAGVAKARGWLDELIAGLIRRRRSGAARETLRSIDRNAAVAGLSRSSPGPGHRRQPNASQHRPHASCWCAERLVRAVRGARPASAAIEELKPVEVWATDEHRLGLKPVRRRVWTPIGKRPLALGHHRYEWLYVTAFVEPTGGETVWWLSDGVSKPLFEKLLADFAETVGAGRARRIVLVLDNAGWHGEAGLAVPEGVRLFFLPPYTPELQPAERLWPLVDEPIVNRETLAEIDAVLAERCTRLIDDRSQVAHKANFAWWPKPTQTN